MRLGRTARCRLFPGGDNWRSVPSLGVFIVGERRRMVRRERRRGIAEMDQPTVVVEQTAMDIEPDWEVYSSDGRKVGDINEVHANYIWVQKGMLFPQDIYIPVTAFDRTEAGRLYLRVTVEQVTAAGWDTMPQEVSENGTAAGVPVPGATLTSG
jgi:hypothetical protein